MNYSSLLSLFALAAVCASQPQHDVGEKSEELDRLAGQILKSESPADKEVALWKFVEENYGFEMPLTFKDFYVGTGKTLSVRAVRTESKDLWVEWRQPDGESLQLPVSKDRNLVIIADRKGILTESELPATEDIERLGVWVNGRLFLIDPDVGTVMRIGDSIKERPLRWVYTLVGTTEDKGVKRGQHQVEVKSIVPASSDAKNE